VCACGAKRPDGGWPLVTELRVYSGSGGAAASEDPPEDPSTEEAGPATPPGPVDKAASPGMSGLYLRLGLTFGVYFMVTAMVVLGTWFAIVRPLWVQETERRVAVLVPEVVAAPVVTPVPAAPEPVAVAEVEEEAPLEESPLPLDEAEPEPEPVRVAARPRPRPRPARPAPAPEPVVAEPEPEPVVAEVEELVPVVARPAPKPEPEVAVPTTARKPVVPIAAASQSGTYVGRARNRPFTLQLVFRPGGVLQGILQVERNGEVLDIGAAGNYTIGANDVLTIALVETGTPDPRVYSGRVSDGAAEGRVSVGGRNRGRFRAKR